MLEKANGIKMKPHFFLGTWQLSGQFNAVSYDQGRELIQDCQKLGIKHYDTAIAYGNGAVEELLGDSLENDCFVVTKIPSIDKSLPIKDAYPSIYVARNIEESCKRLKRNADVYLFHNWNSTWDSVEASQLLETVLKSKYVKAIGISLPNGYSKKLDKNILDQIHYLEIPYNSEEKWVSPSLIEELHEANITVLFRSLFKQGLLVKSKEELNLISSLDRRYQEKELYASQAISKPEDIIRDTLLRYKASLIVGASTKEQAKKNFTTFQTALTETHTN